MHQYMRKEPLQLLQYSCNDSFNGLIDQDEIDDSSHSKDFDLHW